MWPTGSWGLNLNMLKIQHFRKASDTFAFILPQQRPILVSAHAHNFLSSAPKTVTGVTKGAMYCSEQYPAANRLSAMRQLKNSF